MTRTTRDHDIVVYGATGFTGRLVCEHLRDRDGEAVRWAMAGRDPEKLSAVADELGVEVPIIVADSTDPASMAEMACSTAVVCTTVGPYTSYGEPVVAACVEAATDYVDLTGEPQFIRRMIDRHHERAVETGARIVHSCGFDSVPSDLGTLVAQEAMHARHGLHATEVQMRVKGMRGGASGGTLASMVKVVEEAVADPLAAEVLADPYSLLPAGERIGPHTTDRTDARYDEAFGSWSAPFVMEMINARIVRRSNAVLGAPWGRDFLYGEGLLTGDGTKGRATAVAVATGGGIGRAALGFGPLRDLVGRVLPGAGTGPDRGAREAGFFDIRVRAVHPDDPDGAVVVKVVGDRDPGYGATSRMIGEAALVLATGEATVGGGSWTPASALGDHLVRRLAAHAGVTFTVLDPR